MSMRIGSGVARAAGLVALTGLAACGGGDSPGADEIRIGAIFDLTGPTADVGTHYADGLRGFVEWTNRQGGIAGRTLDLAFQDYGYDVGRAEQLYSQYAQRGVVAFMGWGTGDTEALRLRIVEDRIPFTSASLSHVLGDPEEAPYNFLTATTYSDQFFIVLDFIKERHEAAGLPGQPRVALLHNASPFGLSPWQQGGQAYAAQIGVDAEAYEMPRGATDFTAELTQVRQSGAQYVVFQNTSGPVALALRNARSLGLDVTFVCLNWCANELLIDLAPEAAESVMGSMPFAPLSEEVEGTRDIRAYLEGEGISLEETSNAFTQGWWTMAVMAEGIRRTLERGLELTGPNIKASLETLDEFDTGGVSVPITFTADDHRGSKGLRIYIVEDGAWRPVSEFRAVATDP